MADAAPKGLVVIAHPLEQSLNRMLADQAVSALRAKGFDVSLIDLYAEEFEPRLTPGERETYNADTFAPETPAAHRELLKAANVLVLVHPVWWGGVPGIMKGWMDRVFAPGTAFAQPTKDTPLKPLLTELREVVLVSTWGTPWWVDWIMLRRSLRHTISWALLGTCARQSKLTYLPMYRADNAPAKAVDAFARKLTRHLNTI